MSKPLTAREQAADACIASCPTRIDEVTGRRFIFDPSWKYFIGVTFLDSPDVQHLTPISLNRLRASRPSR